MPTYTAEGGRTVVIPKETHVPSLRPSEPRKPSYRTPHTATKPYAPAAPPALPRPPTLRGERGGGRECV